MDNSRHLLNSCICRHFKAWYLLICWELLSFYIKGSHDFRSHFLDLSRFLCVFSPPKPLSFTPNLFLKDFWPRLIFLLLVRSLFFHFFMHFIFCDLTFGVWWKLWGFSQPKRFLQNFWDEFCIFDLKTSCIASHLHYNNVSCILRCVFTLLQTCVLVGLDWAKPMMFLLLYITCSCISCIRTLHSLYSYILNYFGTFLIVSFSLSLSFLC